MLRAIERPGRKAETPREISASLRVGMLLAACVCTSSTALSPVPQAQERGLPWPLVYLRDVDPTIAQDIKYTTADNFTGRSVVGYDAAECILHRDAALALARVQTELKPRGLSLKVYDCYRPRRAVRAFVAWARGLTEDPATKRFHPRLPRAEVVARGYIAPYSSHSRGIAVDVALTTWPPGDTPHFDPQQRYGACTGPKDLRAPDTSLDFGSGYDCFDERSHNRAPSLSHDQAAARTALTVAMARQGFAGYGREWWHFTFRAENAPSFDVPIRPYPGRSHP